MPKHKKEKAGPGMRHQPLATQVAADASQTRRKIKASSKAGAERSENDDRNDGDGSGGGYLPPKMTRKILEQAREQRDEMEQEEEAAGGSTAAGRATVALLGMNKTPLSSVVTASRDSDDSDEDAEDGADFDDYEEQEEDDMDGGKSVVGVGMSEAEEQLVSSFMNAAPIQRRNLADIIMEKIREKEEGEARAAGGEVEEDGRPRFPPKVVEVYTSIGKMLKTYTAGKLPKAFKIIPSLTNWEQILWMTKPENWSSHATLAATKIFASNFNAKMAQRFYNIFLLEACRSDIHENRRLNYHLYQAVRKSVYKPAAFYKGIILPLACSGDCTLREASIFASVLARVTIPATHSAVALLKLAELPYNGATSLFIRVLLNKKYALPYRVIDALVNYFMAFTSEKRDLPVLWHQSFLVFAQRYRGDITRADKERLKELLKEKQHHQITPEVRRQLFMGGCRGDPKTLMTPKPRSLATSGTDAMALG